MFLFFRPVVRFILTIILPAVHVKIAEAQGKRITGIKGQFLFVDIEGMRDHSPRLDLGRISVSRDRLTNTFDTVFSQL